MSYGALLSSKLVGEGRYDEAVAAATREITLQPEEPDAYFQRGQARAGLGLWEEAIQDYAHALSLDDSGSRVDPETVDDELFFALRSLAEARRSEPKAAIATIQRYSSILPAGRHVDDIAKWVDNFNGIQQVWYRERA